LETTTKTAPPVLKMKTEPKLLTRDDFRAGVFARDAHKCVVCKAPAKDAHHILERRLFDDGGYYLDNGASVCEEHHLAAEMTTLSCEQLRECIGIKQTLLPAHLYSDERYDKWGNPILPNGMRLKGDLFFDESVQKILKQGGVLDLFTKYVKYPRTYHLPWSPGVKKDDRVMESLRGFVGKEVVATVKMDGENTTMYSDYIHARSLSANPHPSRNWVKQLHSTIQHNIPDDWRICGENLYAEHSIAYKNLDSWFQLFSVWNERNVCLSWDETVEWAALLGLKMVPILYRGPWNEKLIQSLYQEKHGGDVSEGYVVRIADPFPYSDFKNIAGKYVRKDHVQTHGHWMRSKLTVNGLKSD
jgi:hypothetical protein